MTYEDWFKKYTPMKNHIDKNARFDGTLYETFGPEYQTVSAVDPTFIWTLIESDGKLLIANGKHHVNRDGYFIASIPYSEATAFADVDLED